MRLPPSRSGGADAWKLHAERAAPGYDPAMPLVERWKRWAGTLKGEAMVMSVALRDPRTPWYAKVAAACVVAYALSPIDLIPDPIPVLGYLDDLVLVPAGVWLVRRLIPPAVLADSRARVETEPERAALIGQVGGAVIVVLWAATAVALVWVGVRLWGSGAANR